MADLPYMPVWVSDIMGSARVQAMHGYARGLYYGLLFAEWGLEGRGLPADSASLARLCGVSVEEFETHADDVLQFFDEREDGRLVNDRCEAEIEAAREQVRKNQERSQKAVEAKQRKRQEQAGTTPSATTSRTRSRTTSRTRSSTPSATISYTKDQSSRKSSNRTTISSSSQDHPGSSGGNGTGEKADGGFARETSGESEQKRPKVAGLDTAEKALQILLWEIKSGKAARGVKDNERWRLAAVANACSLTRSKSAKEPMAVLRKRIRAGSLENERSYAAKDEDRARVLLKGVGES